MSKSGHFVSFYGSLPTDNSHFSPVAENGGPDRTRTYDPRLIKAVL